MRTSPIPKLPKANAFTLIEMLVVVAIIVLLMAFAQPALSRTLMATKLSGAGQSLLGAISQAQQIAFANNVPVDIRFFRVPDGFGENPAYRSYQIFRITQVTQGAGAGATMTEALVPEGNLVNLPENILIVDDMELSPALSGEGLDDEREGSSNGYSGVASATYNAWRFMPDGTCRKVGASQEGRATLTFQTLTESFLTITSDAGQPITVANLPKNFFTIQVDPFTGKARSYAPGF